MWKGQLYKTGSELIRVHHLLFLFPTHNWPTEQSHTLYEIHNKMHQFQGININININ